MARSRVWTEQRISETLTRRGRRGSQMGGPLPSRSEASLQRAVPARCFQCLAGVIATRTGLKIALPLPRFGARNRVPNAKVRRTRRTWHRNSPASPRHLAGVFANWRFRSCGTSQAQAAIFFKRTKGLGGEMKAPPDPKGGCQLQVGRFRPAPNGFVRYGVRKRFHCGRDRDAPDNPRLGLVRVWHRDRA